jgi:hypothetical protein
MRRRISGYWLEGYEFKLNTQIVNLDFFFQQVTAQLPSGTGKKNSNFGFEFYLVKSGNRWNQAW